MRTCFHKLIKDNKKFLGLFTSNFLFKGQQITHVMLSHAFWRVGFTSVGYETPCTEEILTYLAYIGKV